MPIGSDSCYSSWREHWASRVQGPRPFCLLVFSLKSRQVLIGITGVKLFEGKIGAVIFDGNHFVTTPNADVIYAPPANGRMTYKHDYRLGQHDPLLWPQPFLADYCHLAAIPRAPETLDDNVFMHVLFHKATVDDFAPETSCTLSGLGGLSWRPLGRLNKVAEKLKEMAKTYQNDDALPKKTLCCFDSLMTSITLSLQALESLPMTRRQTLFVFSEVQRFMLEFIAVHDYMYIFTPRFLNPEPPSELAKVVGAFVNSVKDCDLFFRAGIPVWLVRPAAMAGTIRVDSLVELADPRDYLCLDDASIRFAVSFDGSPTDPRKHETFAKYSHNFLRYSDPFKSPPTLEAIRPPPNVATSSSQPLPLPNVGRSNPPIRSKDSRKPAPCMFLSIYFHS